MQLKPHVDENAMRKFSGLILHAPRSYDLVVWLLTRGRERAFRQEVLAPVRLKPGQSVLDVGCGTGSLALEAKLQVGHGAVHGVDASPEMIARAVRKATKAGLEIDFETAPAQALPFDDGRFDVVMTSMMLHHLPQSSRKQCIREMRRVAKPRGRILVVDFDAPSRLRRGFLGHFHGHGSLKPGEVTSLLADAGLTVIHEGVARFKNLQFVLATNQAVQ
jgi:ubiquinone/menaquinone biosynthesis C-methylase UbiE